MHSVCPSWVSGQNHPREHNINKKTPTLASTAIDAYELPKLIPTTGGMDVSSTLGLLAMPFGTRGAEAISEVNTAKNFFFQLIK